MRFKVVCSGLLALAVMAGAVGFAQAQPPASEKAPPDAILKLSGKSVAAGVGFSWGSGTLSYKGKEYPVSVSGLTVGAVGVASVTATGNVWNLSKLEDFDGNYTGTGAGAAVGGGSSVLALRNSGGVGIEMITTTKGVNLAVAAGGVTLKIKK
jgi:hypothetical protein